MTPADLLDLFVYGSLRKGCENHHLIDGARPLGTGTIAASFYVNGSLSMVHEGEGTVHGEVYRLVDQHHLQTLDSLERHPVWYARRIVQVALENGATIDAWCYFKSERDPDARLVEHGDYLKL
jgi:gamma-glutamylaminecyclotransferase